MRMVFIFLFIMNILFVVWQYLYPSRIEPDVKSLPGHLADIQLMRELSNDVMVKSADSAMDSGLVQGRVICHTLGPFTDGQTTDGLKQQLDEFTDKSAVRVIEEKELHRYVVYVAAKNNDDAVVIGKLLTLQNVSDYYVMTKDGKKRVSLGHFKEKAYADKRVQQIAELGFKPETETVFREYQLYWLDYELSEAQKNSVDALIAPYLQNEVSLLNRDCEK